MLLFDLAQTFYVDPDQVQGSSHTFITGVDLYFYSKPVQGKTKTGIHSPGVEVYLCNTNSDNTPNLGLVHQNYGARMEYSNIAVSTIGATATRFTFRQPIPVPTNKSYGILIKFDGSDNDFVLWYNKAGQKKLGTNSVTNVVSGKVDGYLYNITNGKKLVPKKDADLSFRLLTAKFTSLSETFKIHNRAYEILGMDTTSGRFRGGEYVYQVRSYEAGTINIRSLTTALVGNGTSFSATLSAGDKVIITDGTDGNTDVREVVSVANNTYAVLDTKPSFSNTVGNYYITVVGKVFTFDRNTDGLVLQDVNTNNSIYLTTGTTLKAVDSLATSEIVTIGDYAVDSVIPSFAVKTSAASKVSVTMNFANSSHLLTPDTAKTMKLGKREMMPEYYAVVASRTNEVLAATPAPSMQADLTLTTSNPYSSPYVRQENLDVFVERYLIGNNEVTALEYTNRGQSPSRYISTTVTLADGQTAEDLKVYARIFKPENTSVQIYAKLMNSEDPEAFASKQWTPLELVDEDIIGTSNKANMEDMTEVEFRLPAYHVGTAVVGSFTTESANQVIVSTGSTVNTSISVGDTIRVYSPLFPENYFIDTVTAVNTTTVTVSTPITNSSLVASGLNLEVIPKTHSAFLDAQNQNVATYFNSEGAKFQTYNTFAIKIVPVSEDNINIPYLDDFRAVAVSA